MATVGASARAPRRSRFSRALGDGRRDRHADRADRTAARLAAVGQCRRRGRADFRVLPARGLEPPLCDGTGQLADPRRLDRTVQRAHRRAAGLGGRRTNLPFKGFVRFTASLSYLSPPFLTAIAFVNLFSPNAGLINVLLRDVVGAPWLTFNIFSMTGLVLVTVLHTFPFVYLLAAQRAAVGRRLLRGVGADPWRRQAAHGAVDHRAAGGAGDPVGRPARFRQRDRPVRLAGDHRPARPHLHPADAHLRAVRLPAAIRACLGAVADLRRDHGGGALPPARLSRKALLRDDERQGYKASAHRSRRGRWLLSASACVVFVVAICCPTTR